MLLIKKKQHQTADNMHNILRECITFNILEKVAMIVENYLPKCVLGKIIDSWRDQGRGLLT